MTPDHGTKLSLETRLKIADVLKSMAKDGRIRATKTDVARQVTDQIREFVSRGQVSRIAEAAGITIGTEADLTRTESRLETTSSRTAETIREAGEFEAERRRLYNGGSGLRTLQPVPPPPVKIEQTFDVAAKVREAVDAEIAKLRTEYKAHVATVFQAAKDQVLASIRDELKSLKNETRHNDDEFLETLAEQETKVGELEQELHRLKQKVAP